VSSTLLAVCVVAGFARTAGAVPGITWALGRLSPTCEPPAVFYSGQHVPGNTPCCPSIEGFCAGGGVCPSTGVCPDGAACVAGPVTNRPNAILFIADDQGYCHYGSAGECRSAQSGTPIPAPSTPNVDLLTGYGTMFPIAHDTASWCFPSAHSIFTGRYQKDFHGAHEVGDATFSTVPGVLRGLAGDPAAAADPYNAGDVVGGYCTLLAGKLSAGIDTRSFDGIAQTTFHILGRNACDAGPGGSPPACGTAIRPTYAPFTTGRMTDVFNFLDSLVHRLPGSQSPQYAMQHFFVWYFPHLPHEPLRPPQPIMDYLFGPGAIFPLGGVMDLGRWCVGGSCPPTVASFEEGDFGTDYSYYGQIWWTDDNVRELRRFLAAETAPHCIGGDGLSRFEITSPSQCTGTWSGVTPDLERNTVIVYLTDNGWHLPHSKHGFTENGYRTRLLVYDPRDLPALPPWDPTQQAAPPPQNSPAVAHAIDVLPTLLGFALDTPGSQACPVGPDGFACDGRDLRPVLATAPGGPAAPETLRHSLCGHETARPTAPTHNRYLVTRPGSVGRCVSTAGTACASAAQCWAGTFCVGGHCAPDTPESACDGTTACPAGAVCLGNACRAAPACIGDEECDALLGSGYGCVGKAERWCRNAPNASCTQDADCPACPPANGAPVPCSRLCETRVLKLYVGGSPQPYELGDLFLDPDEQGLHEIIPGSGGPETLVKSMTESAGYASMAGRLNCCIDAWWDGGPGTPTNCTPGLSCPADLTCNE
jgi:hypothetical protein